MAILLATLGCAAHAPPSPPLPETPWRDAADALRILRERAHAVRSVSGTGLLTLMRPDGESVRFDAAVVAAPPQRLRLRAWKLGRAVFDLTLTPDGLWLLAPEDTSMREKVNRAGRGAAELARNWSLLSGAFFDRGDLSVERLPKSLLLTAQQSEGGMKLLCYIDPHSLVPWLYVLEDARHKQQFTLNLGDYAVFDGVPYPRRLQAESIEGRITVRLAELEINGELADGAFVPPRRAEKLP